MRESISRARAGLGGGALFPAAAAAGVGLGTVSVYPYQYLSGPAHILGNSAAIWLLAAFGLGVAARRPARGAIAGAVALVATVLAFFAVTGLLSADVSVRVELFWLAAAVVGGPVFGLCGSMWQGGTADAQGVTSAVMGGAFLAEAVGFQPAPTAGPVAEAVFGVVLTAVLARGGRQRLVALCALPIVVAAGVVCWILIMHVLVTLPSPT